MLKEVFKLNIPDTGILADLYNVEGYVEVKYLEMGKYYRIEKQGNSEEPEDCYTSFEENNSIAFFRIWLENNSIISKEEMISLLKYRNNNIAGLVLLSWMREVFDIDPTVSWVKLSCVDWDAVLYTLTCNEYVRD